MHNIEINKKNWKEKEKKLVWTGGTHVSFGSQSKNSPTSKAKQEKQRMKKKTDRHERETLFIIIIILIIYKTLYRRFDQKTNVYRNNSDGLISPFFIPPGLLYIEIFFNLFHTFSIVNNFHKDKFFSSQYSLDIYPSVCI